MPAAGTPAGAAYANNNIYGNAAFVGACMGMVAGATPNLGTQAYLDATRTAAARAFAQAVDAQISASDAQVTTGAAVTQLAITTNTIAANEQWKAGLLQALCFAAWSGKTGKDATQGDYTAVATSVVAAFNVAVVSLTTP